MLSVLKKHTMAILFPAILVVAGIVYYVLDPTVENSWAPKCPMKLLTGFDCPSCGVQGIPLRPSRQYIRSNPLQPFSRNLNTTCFCRDSCFMV